MSGAEHVIKERVEDVVGFLALISAKYSSLQREWIYRGQSFHQWPLISRAGRLFPKRLSKEELLKAPDLEHFSNWRNKAIAYCNNLPDNDLECLAFAQHYGLATRLLDWTTNPLVALYFAVEQQPKKNGAVFLYKPPVSFHNNRRKQVPLVDLEFDGVMIYTPPPFDRRLLAQAAKFSFHPNPSVPLTANIHGPIRHPLIPRLVKILVPASFKEKIRKQLDNIGVSRVSLFPDADGLSDYMNWTAAN